MIQRLKCALGFHNLQWNKIVTIKHPIFEGWACREYGIYEAPCSNDKCKYSIDKLLEKKRMNDIERKIDEMNKKLDSIRDEKKKCYECDHEFSHFDCHILKAKCEYVCIKCKKHVFDYNHVKDGKVIFFDPENRTFNKPCDHRYMIQNGKILCMDCVKRHPRHVNNECNHDYEFKCYAAGARCEICSSIKDKSDKFEDSLRVLKHTVVLYGLSCWQHNQTQSENFLKEIFDTIDNLPSSECKDPQKGKECSSSKDKASKGEKKLCSREEIENFIERCIWTMQKYEGMKKISGDLGFLHVGTIMKSAECKIALEGAIESLREALEKM